MLIFGFISSHLASLKKHEDKRKNEILSQEETKNLGEWENLINNNNIMLAKQLQDLKKTIA